MDMKLEFMGFKGWKKKNKKDERCMTSV